MQLNKQKKSFFKIAATVLLVTMTYLGASTKKVEATTYPTYTYTTKGDLLVAKTASLIDSVESFFSSIFGKKQEESAPITINKVTPTYTPPQNKIYSTPVSQPVPTQQINKPASNIIKVAVPRSSNYITYANVPPSTITTTTITTSCSAASAASFYGGVSQSQIDNLQYQIDHLAVPPALDVNALNPIQLGFGNVATGTLASGIGYCNIVSGDSSAGLGFHNTASGYHSFAIGGCNNSINSGSGNYISNSGSVAIGLCNISSTSAYGNFTSAMGIGNCASGYLANAVGNGNTASGYYSSALGICNVALNDGSTASGYANAANAYYSIAMGVSNVSNGNFATAIGNCNNASGGSSSAFGNHNTTLCTFSSAFGTANTSSAYQSSAMGYNNTASASYAAAVGTCARATGTAGLAVGTGGVSSFHLQGTVIASGSYSVSLGTVSGYTGGSNVASGNCAVAIGVSNSASGIASTVVGYQNAATADFASAFGSNLVNNTVCSTMLGVGTSYLRVNNNNSVSFSNGASLTAGGTFQNASDRSLKENFVQLDNQEILRKINSLPLTEWNYISEGDSVKHIGPIAQDFYSTFNIGNSSTSISTIDPAGVALVGIQALSARLDELSGSSTFASLIFSTSSLTADDSASVVDVLRSFGAEVVNGVAYLKNVFIEKLTAHDIETKQLQTDLLSVKKGIKLQSSNGVIYCVTIDDYGNFVKTPGECNDLSAVSAPVPIPSVNETSSTAVSTSSSATSTETYLNTTSTTIASTTHNVSTSSTEVQTNISTASST